MPRLRGLRAAWRGRTGRKIKRKEKEGVLPAMGG
jgi:hypothetical protein